MLPDVSASNSTWCLAAWKHWDLQTVCSDRVNPYSHFIHNHGNSNVTKFIKMSQQLHDKREQLLAKVDQTTVMIYGNKRLG
jgi:hypothetical protein